MMSFRTLAYSVAIGVLAGGGAVWLHPWGASPPAAMTAVASSLGIAPSRTDDLADNDDLAQLRADLAELRLRVRHLEGDGGVALLRGELRGLRGTVAHLQDQLSNTVLDASYHPTDTWQDEALDLSPEERFELELEEVQSHFASIEDAYRSEPVDQSWSAAVTASVEDAFAAEEELRDVALLSAECRSGRCRLEIEFDEALDSDDIEFAIAENMLEEAPRMAVQYLDDAGGPVSRAIIYLGRGDRSLAPG